MKNIGNLRAVSFRLGTSLAAMVAVATLGAPTTAWAQTSESTLRGTAPAGSTVVATSSDTGAVRRTTAGPDGTYVIAGLPSGSYHVSAGAGHEGDVTVSVASVSVLDLGQREAAGTIVVTARRQTAEVHSSQVNEIVSLHDIQALPQVTRNFLEFADTVPGIQFTTDSGRNTSLRGGAQLDSAVNVYIDGVSQKDYVGGGSGITGTSGPQGNGDPGNPFPQLAIGEYKVVTSNYTAEYGDAASAIIIARTKSGTNQFHFEAFGDYTNQHMRARTPAEIGSNVAKASAADKEYGVAVSGPIIKNLAHFFFTWEHKGLSNQTDVTPGGLITQAQAQTLLPTNVGNQFGPVNNPFTENLYFGKIDIEPSAQDRIEASLNFRLEHSIAGGGGQTAESASAPYTNNTKRGDIRWQHSGDNWVNEADVSYQKTDSTTTTSSASPQNQYVYFTNPYFPTGGPGPQTATLIVTNGPGSGVGAISSQSGFTYKDDLTLSNIHFGGDHTFKLGVSYGSIKLTSQNASADLANATYYYAVTPSGVATNPYEVQFPALTAGINTAGVTTRDKQYSFYAQDDWNVNHSLTVNLGLRVDHEVVPAYLNYVTPANVVAAINGPFPGLTASYASVLALGDSAHNLPGLNISNYISTGNNRKAPWNFSPRIGFSYDFSGDGKHVLFGGYARAYNRNQFGTLALETTKIALNSNPQVYFPSAYTQDSFATASNTVNGGCYTNADTANSASHCYQWNAAYLTPAGLAGLPVNANSHEVDLLNNNLKTPHSDQFSLGIRNRIGDWNTQVTVSYVESYDGIVGHWGGRYANGAIYDPACGCQWGSQGVPGIGSLILWDNGAKDKDFQLSLAAQKPYTKESHWGATVAYTFTAAAQNNVAGGSNPYQVNNNQYLFDLPNPSVYGFYRASAVPRSRLVVTYNRDLFWGISSAAKLVLATPQSSFNIYGCVTGSVCNQYGGGTLAIVSKTPNNLLGYKDLDVQFTKNFSLPHQADAYVRVDILNVFNWHNYDPGATQFPIPAGATAAQLLSIKPIYNTTGPIIGTPLQLKLSAGLKF